MPRNQSVRQEFNIPAHQAVEHEAREQAAKESQESFPENVRGLIQATIGEAGEGVVNQLLIRFGKEHDQILQTLLHIDQRLKRFLLVEEGKEKQPSFYAEQIMALLHEPSPNSERAKIVKEFQLYVTAELNPLLHELHTQLASIPTSGVEKPEDVLILLKAGESTNQKTTSLFGIVKVLAERFPEWPAFSAEAETNPKKLVVLHPLDPSFADYWKQRLEIHEMYGDVELPDLIVLRTSMSVYELHEAAQNTKDTAASAAYLLIAEWMGHQLDFFEADEARDIKQLAAHTRRLHFGQLEPDAFIDFVNAVELIKKDNPELYVRLCGIAPRYHHGVSGDTEAGQSDLFGNVFQLALARSLELKVRSDKAGNTLFHERLEGLTDLAHAQPNLVHLDLNKQQLKQLQENITGFQKQASQGESSTARATSAMFALITSRFYLEAHLPHLLEEIRSREWDDERETLFDELRRADPERFLKLMKKMPEELKADKDFIDLLKKRIPDRHFAWLKIRKNEFYDFPSGVVYRQDLWKTAPNETILSNAFFEEIERTIKEAESAESAKFICRILDAHPDITTLQWEEWFESLLKRPRIQDRIRRPTLMPMRMYMLYRTDRVIIPFVKALTPEDLEKTRSSFFRTSFFHDAIKPSNKEKFLLDEKTLKEESSRGQYNPVLRDYRINGPDFFLKKTNNAVHSWLQDFLDKDVLPEEREMIVEQLMKNFADRFDTVIRYQAQFTGILAILNAAEQYRSTNLAIKTALEKIELQEQARFESESDDKRKPTKRDYVHYKKTDAEWIREEFTRKRKWVKSDPKKSEKYLPNVIIR